MRVTPLTKLHKLSEKIIDLTMQFQYILDKIYADQHPEDRDFKATKPAKKAKKRLKKK